MPRVLFVSSNGAGMGHLTRLLAMARRARSVTPVFLSLSQAVPVVEREGFAYEYVPSAGALHASSAEWNRVFDGRFAEALDTFAPAAVVFDGTYPYRGITAAARARPDIPFVWSRRGMWKEGLAAAQLLDSNLFSLIIEPGDHAAERDRGPTSRRTDALQVAPVTYLDADDALDRDEALLELGLDPGRPAALVSLGAGNINDTSSELGTVTSALLDGGDVQVVVTQAQIASRGHEADARVRSLSVYPVVRYFAAFDMAFAAPGYNAFHELVNAGLPTAFVPNLHTQTDDQLARASFAHDAGLGLSLSPVSPATAAAAVKQLLDPERRAQMRARCLAMRRPNGATAAMEAIEQLVADRTAVADV
ncbi:MAG: UDP-N-acetylglucosamine:LPS N-acetylglucosamine transferase [Frankiales bacterium]|nr:UDP-N-acetylglucosamine:LPS N-acetylglucosamine transferase [Frankiales bacterium]